MAMDKRDYRICLDIFVQAQFLSCHNTFECPIHFLKHIVKQIKSRVNELEENTNISDSATEIGRNSAVSIRSYR